MCKSHKMRGSCRWTHKELDSIKRSEKEILDAKISSDYER